MLLIYLFKKKITFSQKLHEIILTTVLFIKYLIQIINFLARFFIKQYWRDRSLVFSPIIAQ